MVQSQVLRTQSAIGKTRPYGAIAIDITLRGRSGGPRNHTVDLALVPKRSGSDRKKNPQKSAYTPADLCPPNAEVGSSNQLGCANLLNDIAHIPEAAKKPLSVHCLCNVFIGRSRIRLIAGLAVEIDGVVIIEGGRADARSS